MTLEDFIDRVAEHYETKGIHNLPAVVILKQEDYDSLRQAALVGGEFDPTTGYFHINTEYGGVIVASQNRMVYWS